MFSKIICFLSVLIRINRYLRVISKRIFFFFAYDSTKSASLVKAFITVSVDPQRHRVTVECDTAAAFVCAVNEFSLRVQIFNLPWPPV